MTRTPTGTLDAMDGIRWQEQTTRDALAWLPVRNGNKAVTLDRKGFEAGHAQGWRDCLNVLIAQGIITRTDKKMGEF